MLPHNGAADAQLAQAERKIKEWAGARGADRLFLLTDSNVAPMIVSLLPDSPRLTVEAGEGSKSLAGAEQVWNFLVAEGALRRSVLVNVGGGMITDLGGFAAATFKRGISTVNLPTTLLGAVDAAVGGKTGINFAGLKNEIGAFHSPIGVFPLTSLFPSLSRQEWLSGVGEAIKTALLDSEELFELAVSEEFVVRRDPKVVDEVVRRCAAFKERIVAGDFREQGGRKILNLGHTAGHALESLMMARGRYIPHGIAVAHGLRMTLERSRDLPGADGSLQARYDAVLRKYFPQVEITDADREEMNRLMAHDKKNTEEGKPAWVLLPRIGCAVVE